MGTMNLDFERFKQKADEAVDKIDKLIGNSLEEAIEENIEDIYFFEELQEVLEELREIAVIVSSIEISDS